MAEKSVHIHEELESYAAGLIEDGEFRNLDEVVNAAIKTLRCERQDDDAKMAALNAALEEGERSGIAPDGVFERVRARCGLPPRQARA